MIRPKRALSLLRAAAFLGALGAGHSGDEFYIVSSVDAARSRLVLKRPTEVTVVVRVGERTADRSEDGKPLRFSDLRAGDTIWVVASKESDGQLSARAIRRGPMTLQELQKRYLK